MFYAVFWVKFWEIRYHLCIKRLARLLKNIMMPQLSVPAFNATLLYAVTFKRRIYGLFLWVFFCFVKQIANKFCSNFLCRANMWVVKKYKLMESDYIVFMASYKNVHWKRRFILLSSLFLTKIRYRFRWCGDFCTFFLQMSFIVCLLVPEPWMPWMTMSSIGHVPVTLS